MQTGSVLPDLLVMLITLADLFVELITICIVAKAVVSGLVCATV